MVYSVLQGFNYCSIIVYFAYNQSKKMFTILSIIVYNKNNDFVAQLGERHPDTVEVAGSSPVGITNL